MDLATRFAPGGLDQEETVLSTIRLQRHPCKPTPTSVLHLQELQSSFSAVLTDPKVAANSPSMDGDNHSSLLDLEPA